MSANRRWPRVLVVAVTALLMALASCSSGGSSGKPRPEPRAWTSTKPAPATAAQPPSSNTQPSSRAAPAQDLTTAQRVGQRIVYSYKGASPPQSLLDHIRNGEAAGVIFFGENITSRSQITSVIARLKAANAQSPVHEPLLLMTDQEGGLVNRLDGAPDRSAKEDGAADDPVRASTEAGKDAGQNLAGVGMNLNLAPVLGVYREDGDFLDSAERSFSADPAQVRDDASAFIRGQQGEGVAATAKHFPGLGAAPAGASTDEQPVRLDVPLDELRSTDELPYPKAIDSGVKLVMASWAKYPALDGDRPAGLSPTVIRGELRGRLGYRGVTVTDALEANALRAYGDSGQRSVLAAQAGMDLMLASARDVHQGEHVATGLAGALDSGKLDHERFDAAVSRVSALRRGLAD